ncbi:ribonuclease H [Senna tora]|uniref:Ribonuclease H n=1 Tax=Senna tora TaxID=362788 RepID=A0A834WVY7_9FABA|nr:ribonuclease H [Senna tora]
MRITARMVNHYLNQPMAKKSHRESPSQLNNIENSYSKKPRVSMDCNTREIGWIDSSDSDVSGEMEEIRNPNNIIDRPLPSPRPTRAPLVYVNQEHVNANRQFWENCLIVVLVDERSFKANQDICANVDLLLSMFGQASGLFMNKNKSEIKFSPNTYENKKNHFLSIINYKGTNSLGKYLGAFIDGPNSDKQNAELIIDHLQQKLTGWKASMLSQAARFTLIQAVLSTIPLYTLHFTSLTDKYARKPKAEGGLGLRSIQGLNHAILGKQLCRIITSNHGIMNTIMRAKYVDPYPNGNLTCRPYDSPLWKKMFKYKHLVTDHLKWRVGDGSSIHLYDRYWVPPDYHTHPFTKVSQLMSGGFWDFAKLRRVYNPRKIQDGKRDHNEVLHRVSHVMNNTRHVFQLATMDPFFALDRPYHHLIPPHLGNNTHSSAITIYCSWKKDVSRQTKSVILFTYHNTHIYPLIMLVVHLKNNMLTSVVQCLRRWMLMPHDSQLKAVIRIPNRNLISQLQQRSLAPQTYSIVIEDIFVINCPHKNFTFTFIPQVMFPSHITPTTNIGWHFLNPL